MIYCRICHAKNAYIRFPKDSHRLDAWLKSLEINEVPKDYERICCEHFQDSDFEVKASGRKFPKQGAIPSRHGYPGGSKSLYDHNYAETMGTEEIQYPPEIMMLLAFSLLLFFDFCLNVPQPTQIQSDCPKETGKI